jgi:molybdopterin converting factor small subunit
MITVRLFGQLKSLANNQPELSFTLSHGRQVRNLVEAVEAAYPMIGELLHKKKVLISVNHEIAHQDTMIQDGDEVALLPPFAGGAL